MHIIGLTGGIAMGKSHVARIFGRFGVPVFDADAAVHALFRERGGLPLSIDARFPGVLDARGAVDRSALGQRVLGDDQALADLEGLVHPAVGEAQRRFLNLAARAGEDAVVLDIPLLLETGGDGHCDLVIVVEANSVLQRARALARPGMTEAKLAAITKKQMPAHEKRRRADVIIPSGYDRGATVQAVARVLETLPGLEARAWNARWKRGRPTCVKSCSTPKPRA